MRVESRCARPSRQSPHKESPGGKAGHLLACRVSGHLHGTQDRIVQTCLPLAESRFPGLALLAAGFLFINWTGHRMDAQMRNEIFLQAKMVAQAVDNEYVTALSGAETDVELLAITGESKSSSPSSARSPPNAASSI